MSKQFNPFNCAKCGKRIEPETLNEIWYAHGHACCSKACQHNLLYPQAELPEPRTQEANA